MVKKLKRQEAWAVSAFGVASPPVVRYSFQRHRPRRGTPGKSGYISVSPFAPKAAAPLAVARPRLPLGLRAWRASHTKSHQAPANTEAGDHWRALLAYFQSV